MLPDPGNVQSMIIGRYPHRLRCILLFAMGPADSAKRFLRRWAGTVNGGETPAETDEPVYHFAFNWPAIARLLDGGSAADGLDPLEGAEELPSFFTDPASAPHARSTTADLGLTDENAAAHWWGQDTDPDALDVAMFCYFRDEDQKRLALEAIRRDAADCGLHEWQLPTFSDKALSGRIPSKGVLHFGFRDGVSKVDLDWQGDGGPGKTDIREVLLGYSNDTFKTSPVNPGPWNDFVRDGSFVAVTWLYQDVAAFNRFLKDNRAASAAHSGAADPEEWLAAKMMGRWRDGSALAVHPETMPDEPDLTNTFGYANDPAGQTTPLFSHIRVCNPRDQQLTAANAGRFRKGPPRLIRRGFSYGPPLEGTVDDGVDRGLVGVFACARINEQLYTVLRWIQTTDFSDLFFDVKRGWLRQDNVFGLRRKHRVEASANIPVASAPPLELPLGSFIRFKGLSLFMAPSLKSLKRLTL